MSGAKSRTAFFRAPECAARVACDGNVLQKGRVEKGVCGKCEEAQAKRGRRIAPRGINYREKGEIIRPYDDAGSA